MLFHLPFIFKYDLIIYYVILIYICMEYSTIWNTMEYS